MNDDKIISIVRDAVNQIKKDLPNVDLHTKMEDIGFDSLEFIKFIVAIEDHFGFNFLDEDLVLNQYREINDFVELISKRVEE